MKQAADSSVTNWIQSLKGGDADAAQRLWQRYMEDLIRLARSRLRGAPRAVEDEEDAALGAFDSFCRGAARGRYPQVADRADFWRLLVVITERKALDQAQHERRRKRGGGRLVGMSERQDADHKGEGVNGVPSPHLSPEMSALVADQCRCLLGSLADETLRRVALMKMEGFTHEEIADRLGCSLRSVGRKIERIRLTWETAGGDEA
jgi:DNA-directed RNA polymerase specialized sigma24 family protein